MRETLGSCAQKAPSLESGSNRSIKQVGMSNIFHHLGIDKKTNLVTHFQIDLFFSSQRFWKGIPLCLKKCFLFIFGLFSSSSMDLMIPDLTEGNSKEIETIN